MKYINTVLVYTFIFFFSCSSEKETKLKIVRLANGLGKITFNLPNNYDTLYNWRVFSDCKCCEFHKTRIADSHYSLPRESGFIYEDKSDSLMQITIKEDEFLTCRTKYFKPGIRFEWLKDFEKNKRELKDSNYVRLNFENIIVDNKICELFAYKSKKKANQYVYIRLTTEMKGYPIDIECECLGKNCKNFSKDIISILKKSKFT